MIAKAPIICISDGIDQGFRFSTESDGPIDINDGTVAVRFWRDGKVAKSYTDAPHITSETPGTFQLHVSQGECEELKGCRMFDAIFLMDGHSITPVVKGRVE